MLWGARRTVVSASADAVAGAELDTDSGVYRKYVATTSTSTSRVRSNFENTIEYERDDGLDRGQVSTAGTGTVISALRGLMELDCPL